MVKIRALKDYVFAPWSLDKGQTAKVPDNVGAKLVSSGLAEYLLEQKAEPAPAPAAQKKTGRKRARK